MVEVCDRTTGCLFCANVDGRFTAEEHVVPLALGNTLKSGLVDHELVIPPGEICDKCNGRRLGPGDQALAGWPPVSAFRTFSQIRNRRRRLVDAVAGTEWEYRQDPKDPLNFELHVDVDTGPGSGRDDVARALCKIALETRWLEDPEDARSARWDAVSAAAIGGPLPATTLVGLMQPGQPGDIDITPRCAVRVDPDSASLRLCLRLEVVGLIMVLLIETPAMPIAGSGWWRLDPVSGSLVGPDSMWMGFRGTATDRVRIAPGEPDPPERDRSQLPSGDPAVRLFVQPSSERS
jgi:hypothetical protein